MAISSTKYYIIFALVFVDMIPKLLINGQQRVPCLFHFGDSFSDNGNNNDLISIAKADYLPYGIDFVYGPAGRFTNGLHIPDFVAMIDDIAGGSNTIIQGLNYASSSAGILDETSLQVGQRIPMNQQLRNHQGTVNRIGAILGNQTTANNLLRRCLYTVTVGNSDYINNYYYDLPLALIRIIYTPEQFADRLIQQYSQQLTTLYNLQARKVAVFGVAAIGYLPSSISLYPTNGSACVGFINDAVQIFNHKLISLINNLNTNLPSANFTYVNLYSFLTADLTSILDDIYEYDDQQLRLASSFFMGIKVPNAPCCQLINQLVGLCVPNGDVCSNRDEYTYFDNYHPTQIVANYTASRAYVAQSPTDAIPIDIRTLIQ